MSEHRALEADLLVRAGAGDESFSVEARFVLEEGVLVFFGPSGAGKTLTLRALAGLVRPARGRVALAGAPLFDDATATDVPVHRRRIGYVPQHQALFPFLDVEENVAFALGRHGASTSDAEVATLLDELGLAALRRRRPASLSGGEKQRVALARALASRPALLLLDEPFAAIDLEGRRDLRKTLRAAIDARDIPAVIVTHDLGDAIAMGDRLVRFEPRSARHAVTGSAGAPREILAGLVADELGAATRSAQGGSPGSP